MEPRAILAISLSVMFVVLSLTVFTAPAVASDDEDYSDDEQELPWLLPHQDNGECDDYPGRSPMFTDWNRNGIHDHGKERIWCLRAYTLEWEAYDYDWREEVTVRLNGQVVAILPLTNTPENNGAWERFSFDITAFIVDGTNTITFTQNSEPTSSKSRDLVVTDPAGAVVFSEAPPRTIWNTGRPSTTYTFERGQVIE